MTDATKGEQSADLHPSNTDTGAVMTDDESLGALFDQIEAGDAPDTGPARGEDGKFVSTAPNDTPGDIGEADAPAPADPQEGGEPGEDAAPVVSSAAQAVPLPANWNGMEADWAKIPADVQAKIAARDREIHARMSEQGRQISTLKPLHDAVQQHRDVLDYHKMPDGSPIEPAFAVDFLFKAQRQLDANPIGGLIEIADRYGVREHLAAALNGQIPIPQTPQPAGMSPADVERIIKESLSEDAAIRAASDELSRLSKDKPLFSEIAEDDMVHAIHRSRAKLGETASKEAVFDLAYDMAVNADPDLRAKAAAAVAAAGAAAKAAAEAAAKKAPDPKQTADAKRATSVNVISTSSGKARELTEDELLAQVFDEIHAKG